jgi:hypothetical protein
MNKQREHLKLHASPHWFETTVACHEVWDTEGDSRDLASRRSSNLRHQNLRRPAKRRRRPATSHQQWSTAPPTVGRRCPVVPLSSSYGCPPPLPLLVLIPPPTIFVKQPAIKSKKLSTYKKDIFRNRCEIKNIITSIKNNLHMCRG